MRQNRGGVKDQPKFINIAIEAETDKKPEELLRILKEIEKEFGRTETVKWGPRVIDLDILFYDDLILKTPDLEIPHPLLHEREFVLKPLCEIAPDKKTSCDREDCKGDGCEFMTPIFML